MARDRLSAWLDAYRTDLRGGLLRAVRDGYRQLALNSVRADLDPRAFTRSARRHFRNHLKTIGLDVQTLVADYPGLGLADPIRASERLEHFRRTLEMCAELRIPRAGVNVAGLGDPERGGLAREMLGIVAELSDRTGVQTAVLDADSPTGAGIEAVRALGCPTLRAAIDTAPLAEGGLLGELPVESVATAYLRDVRRRGHEYEDVAYGAGDVDFAALLGKLEAGAACDTLVIRPGVQAGVDALRQGRDHVMSLLNRVSPP